MIKGITEGLTQEEQAQAVEEATDYGHTLFVSLKESLEKSHDYTIPPKAEIAIMGSMISMLTVQAIAIASLEKKIAANVKFDSFVKLYESFGKYRDMFTRYQEYFGKLQDKVLKLEETSIKKPQKKTKKTRVIAKSGNMIQFPVKGGRP